MIGASRAARRCRGTTAKVLVDPLQQTIASSAPAYRGMLLKIALDRDQAPPQRNSIRGPRGCDVAEMKWRREMVPPEGVRGDRAKRVEIERIIDRRCLLSEAVIIPEKHPRRADLDGRLHIAPPKGVA